MMGVEGYLLECLTLGLAGKYKTAVYDIRLCEDFKLSLTFLQRTRCGN